MRKTSPNFSRSEYTLDQTLTEELQFKRENGLFESPPISKKPLLILFLLASGLTAIGFPLVITLPAFLVSLFILWTNQHHRECDAITIDCPACSQAMAKEEQASVERFICHRCKIYATGRDFS